MISYHKLAPTWFGLKLTHFTTDWPWEMWKPKPLEHLQSVRTNFLNIWIWSGFKKSSLSLYSTIFCFVLGHSLLWPPWVSQCWVFSPTDWKTHRSKYHTVSDRRPFLMSQCVICVVAVIWWVHCHGSTLAPTAPNCYLPFSDRCSAVR